MNSSGTQETQVKSRLLPLFVIIGGALGLLIGSYSPGTAQILKPFGAIYVRLMEVVVLPYLVSSLILGLGRLSPAEALTLFRKSWPVYLLLWGTAFVCLGIAAATVPLVSKSTLVDFSPQLPSATGDAEALIELLVPDNLFQALSQDYIPSVVLMGVIFGIAIQHTTKPTTLLDVMATIRNACIRVWGWIVLLAPIGVCALFAQTVASFSLSGLAPFMLYVAVFEPQRAGADLLDPSDAVDRLRAAQLPGDPGRFPRGPGDCGRHLPVGRGPAADPGRGSEIHGPDKGRGNRLTANNGNHRNVPVGQLPARPDRQFLYPRVPVLCGLLLLHPARQAADPRDPVCHPPVRCRLANLVDRRGDLHGRLARPARTHDRPLCGNHVDHPLCPGDHVRGRFRVRDHHRCFHVLRESPVQSASICPDPCGDGRRLFRHMDVWPLGRRSRRAAFGTHLHDSQPAPGRSILQRRKSCLPATGRK
ncbi:cation:dicarboxylase symporter family transporter [Roseibium sp. RKSG952]|nr:cation:dicarboxylase symporter family transporter [Roseibium sp. RKSG952]